MPDPVPRDAVIFVPGIGNAGCDQSIEGVTARIANALGRATKDPKVAFVVESDGRDEDFAHDSKAGVRNISRKVGDRTDPAVDVYKIDYSARLTREYEQLSLVAKSGLLFLTLAQYTPRTIGALVTGSGKSRGEKWQLLYAAGLMSLLWIYMGVLVWATVETGVVAYRAAVAQVQQPAEAGGTEAPPAPPPGRRSYIVQAVAVVSTMAAALIPGLTQTLTRAAVLYLCAINYLGYGSRRAAMVGQLTELIQHVTGKPDVEYRRVYVVAYSFGTVISLDTLFPHGTQPGERCRRVAALVTVGSPFDLIRSYWPKYFHRRRAADGMEAVRWANIYSPVDILGSNFRDDDVEGGPNEGIQLDAREGAPVMPVNIAYNDGPDVDSQGWFSELSLVGLRAHTAYWGREYEAESSCFSLIVHWLYDGDPLLQQVRPGASSESPGTGSVP